MATIGFIGGGNIASALAKGIIESGNTPAANIYVCDPEAVRGQVMARLGCQVLSSNVELATRVDIVFLAVKPKLVAHVIQEIAMAAATKLVVSVAAGVTLRSIESGLPPGTRVIRVMPNTPCLVGAGAAAIAPGGYATEDDVERVKAIMCSVGICVQVDDAQMNAVTALSGSGPAYAFMMIEALADGGVHAGLPRDIAQKLAAQTLLGAARMVLETGKQPGQLKDEVCSPAGTTIAAVKSLEKDGLRAALINAVVAATARGDELSRY